MKYCLLYIIILSGYIATASAQDTASDSRQNPLLKMVGKPYYEYHAIYGDVMDSLFYTDSFSRAELVRLFEEAAASDNSGEWDLNHRNIACHVRFFESRNGGYIADADYTAEHFVTDLLALADEAGKNGFQSLRIKSLFYVAETYRIFLKDYEKAFQYYLEAVAETEGISAEKIPLRAYIYREMAGLYYTFQEYNDAAYYYRKLLENPDTSKNSDNLHLPALNELGLCYRYGNQDYDRSDSCFVRLMEWTRPMPELWRETWGGIAMANIGYNYSLRGKQDTALLYLVPAMAKMTRPNDYPFRSRCAADIAAIYLEKQQPAAAKKYIDLALDYHNRSGVPEKTSRLYEVLFGYYARIGNQQKSIAYYDSSLIAKTKENDAFSGLVLRRVEQQLRVADNKIHEQELQAEQMRSKSYMQTAFLMSAALVVILVLLGFTFFFYRRKRNAYHELVRRSQSWAGIITPEEKSASDETRFDGKDVATENENIVPETAVVPEETDRLIMESIEKAMSDSKLYKRTDLTLDAIAAETGFNRYHISTVLNRCAGRNFYSYINEYRVKEAIRLISDSRYIHMTLEGIAFEAGFNDRTSFYRSFKKITGLSPGDFRKNMNGKSSG